MLLGQLKDYTWEVYDTRIELLYDPIYSLLQS